MRSAAIVLLAATALSAQEADPRVSWLAQNAVTIRSLDLGNWLRAPLTARFFGYIEMRADWSRVVDGVVFLKKMERSNRTP